MAYNLIFGARINGNRNCVSVVYTHTGRFILVRYFPNTLPRKSTGPRIQPGCMDDFGNFIQFQDTKLTSYSMFSGLRAALGDMTVV